MAGRRLLLFVALLLVIGVVASATVPRERDPAVRRTVPAPVQAGPAARVVTGRLPGKRDVRARVGDIVQIDVRNGAQDTVQIVALGISEPVDPDIPAQLVFDADRAGRFGVSLRDAGRRIGTVEIREAG